MIRVQRCTALARRRSKSYGLGFGKIPGEKRAQVAIKSSRKAQSLANVDLNPKP